MIVCWQAMSCDARLETPPALPHEDSDSSSFSYSSDDDDLCDEADHLSLPSTSSLLHSALTRIASGNEYGTSRDGHAGNDHPTAAPIQDRNEQSYANTAATTSIEQPQPRQVSPTLGKDAVEASTCGDDAMSFSDDNDESSKAALLSSEDSDDDDDDDDASDRLGGDRLPSDEEEIELESDEEEDEESEEEDEEEENEEEKDMEEEGEGKEKSESEGKDADSEKQDKGEELFKIKFF